jgi:acyl-CoA reductase-like NAD-dependent aldehyde dehydrogenase
MREIEMNGTYLTYKDIDAAILEVKKRPKPLSGFLFSRDQKAIDHFLASLSFGGGAINQVNVATGTKKGRPRFDGGSKITTLRVAIRMSR